MLAGSTPGTRYNLTLSGSSPRSMRHKAPPYMHDVLPVPPSVDAWLHTPRWRALERIFRDVCRLHGYREIRTPVMESTDLFARSVGAGTDIVSKEMFTFTDRGERSMTLRAEGTAPVVRAFLENGLASGGSMTKLYYIATIYRYEHGQRGRYREHQQTGIEALGGASPAVDAEVIALAVAFLTRLGIADVALRLNSVGCPTCRPGYLAALLAFAEKRLGLMSRDNRRRFEENPLRMLDSKDPDDHAALEGAPVLRSYLCAECGDHFTELRAHLDDLGIAYELDDRLVRGLDYYTRTAFEFVSPQLGAQDVIGGGGRYDGLIEQCGGPPTPGVGFGIGTERCLMVLDRLEASMMLEDERPIAYVISPGAATSRRAVAMVAELRRAGISAETDYLGRSIKAQMRTANKLGAQWAVILGEVELARNAAAVKNLRNSDEQREIPISGLVSFILDHLHNRVE